MRSWTTLTISWSTLLRSEQQGDEVQEWMHKVIVHKCITLDLKINDLIQGIEVFVKCRKVMLPIVGIQSRRASIRTGTFDLPGRFHLGSHLP